jgi:hypothetical protein
MTALFKSITSTLSILFFFAISFSVDGQSLDWVVEPIITDAESINLHLDQQNNNLNLVSIRSARKYGMKNVKNELLAPCEFDAPQVWSSGKYFDMRTGRVQRYFDTEGYEVDHAEVDAYQKTVSSKKEESEKDQKLEKLKKEYDWLDFYAERSKYGSYKYVAINRATRDTISSGVREKVFFVFSDKYTIQNEYITNVATVRSPTGEIVKTLVGKPNIKEMRSDRAIVSLDYKKGVVNNRGDIIVPLEYRRIRFVTDNYLALTKDDDLYELVDLDGERVPNAVGEHIYSLGEENKIIIVVSKYNTAVFDVNTKSMINHPFKVSGKNIRAGNYLAQNRDTLSGLFNMETSTEIMPFTFRRAKRNGAFIVAGNYKKAKRGRRGIVKTRYLSIINMEGEVVLKDSMKSINIVGNKIMVVKGSDDRYKVYDVAGKLIKELSENTNFRTSKNSKYFSLVKKGEVANYLTVEDYLSGNVKNGYNSVGERNANKDKSKWFSIVTRNGKMGLINNAGDIIIPIELDEFKLAYPGHKYFPAKKDGKWGVLKNPLYEAVE